MVILTGEYAAVDEVTLGLFWLAKIFRWVQAWKIAGGFDDLCLAGLLLPKGASRKSPLGEN